MKIYTVNNYTRDTFGKKLYKLSLDIGCTCPNRDGTLSDKGCIFCSENGSGDFAAARFQSVDIQIERAKEFISSKIKSKNVGYIAYFQAHTNTYGDLQKLEKCFMEAAVRPDIDCISIATRPDCIDDRVIDMLKRLRTIKPVWVELGLQTIHKHTEALINRCFSLDIYDRSIRLLSELDVHIIVHMIIGLPKETTSDMIETARYIGESGAHGIKFQLLHVLRNTPLADMYKAGEFSLLTMEEYSDILIECIRVIPENMVIHRITGDGPKKILIGPSWSGNKKKVLNYLNKRIENALR